MMTADCFDVSRHGLSLLDEPPHSSIPHPTSGSSRRATSLEATVAKDAHRNQIACPNTHRSHSDYVRCSRLPRSQTVTSLISLRKIIPSQLSTQQISRYSATYPSRMTNLSSEAKIVTNVQQDSENVNECEVSNEREESLNQVEKNTSSESQPTERRSSKPLHIASTVVKSSQTQYQNELDQASAFTDIAFTMGNAQTIICKEDRCSVVLPERLGNKIVRDLMVYVSKDIAYWTGRFVAVCDRLRNDSIRDLVTQDIFVSQTPIHFSLQCAQGDVTFESTEARRTIMALNILRGYCKSKAATRSFEVFATQLQKTKKKIRYPNSSKLHTDVMTIGQSDAVHCLDIHRSVSRALDSDNSCIQKGANIHRSETWDINTLSNKNTKAYNVSVLKKSQTTINLPLLSYPFVRRDMEKIQHCYDRSSYSHDIPSNTVKAFGLGVAAKASETLKKAGGRVFSYGSATSAHSDHSRLTMSNISNARKPKDLSDSSRNKIKGRVVSERKSYKIASGKINQRDGGVLDGTEGFEQESRELVRSTSGVLVKKIILAGIKEIREAGKRVRSLDLENGEKVRIS